ncbi:hypothetical protein O6H91_01G011300 [Diphasiastrum complanatum]|uniref:Uncharacterized protein n=3 Tax=Diphasiastrum complanatum TaxID=34168 RepID=A0ACC2EN36_DIPCM|nr:hypothetical protein O6H91_01G011300 [Diphasiastrum complanatum]KAJ7567900.1 hypothetical protein O6H91_01G011300 [Diphasiastrum complanatum]KAJ7567903.1 hypothetical protein O6H91_01G011300 [Diphasiastrum complanatum]
MAQRSPPVFRDFLGAGLKVTAKQPELSVTDSVRFSQHSGGLAGCEDGEVSTRACSTYSSGSAPGPIIAAAAKELVNASERRLGLRQRVNTGPTKFLRDKDIAYNGLGHTRGNKRASSPSGSPLRESLLLSKDCSEALQSSKISLFNQRDNTGGASANPSISQEDLSLRQQPLESKCPVSIWLQTSVFKTDLTTGASKRVKCSKPTVLNLASSGAAAGPVNFGALTQVSTLTENSAGGSLLCQLPGDEGSRTGLRGSGLAKLLKECPPELPSGPHQALPFQHHLNLASGNALALPSCSHQISAPASRPLTVFYGGQAHVFDDVSPEKVDSIMMLAGSNGRSWSTIYAPRGSVDEFSSGNDIPLTIPTKQKDADRHKDKILSSGTSLNETLSSNLLQSLHRKKADFLQSG